MEKIIKFKCKRCLNLYSKFFNKYKMGYKMLVCTKCGNKERIKYKK